MKVVILKGSPRGRRSDSSKIADAFVRGTGKRAFLFVTGFNPDASFMDGIKAWWGTDLRYLGWRDAGSLFVHGVQSPGCEAVARAVEQAREMGARL